MYGAVTYYVEMTEVAGLLAEPSGALKVVSERRYEVGPPTNLTQDLNSPRSDTMYVITEWMDGWKGETTKRDKGKRGWGEGGS
uniref:Uncharacterized protein n=1 Tax=Timema genevievae TaxID=629358 RepID=A0A7R9PHX9_TIMGE|nr:unnamed protein product [Timema genevievae]